MAPTRVNVAHFRGKLPVGTSSGRAAQPAEKMITPSVQTAAPFMGQWYSAAGLQAREYECPHVQTRPCRAADARSSAAPELPPPPPAAPMNRGAQPRWTRGD
jgi:hypothetical protein